MMTITEHPWIASCDMGMDVNTLTYLTIRCHRCGDQWRQHVPSEFTDWRLIAEEFETRYKWIIGRMNGYIKECETECGPLPSTQRLQDQLLQLRDLVERMHQKDRAEKNAGEPPQ